MADRLVKSTQLLARANAVSPGGVHSPVRAFTHVNENPIFIEAASGSEIYDVDGNTYVDFCMAFGPLILGHRNERVHNAVLDALDHGWSYGAAEPASLELAEFICDRINWIDAIRFVNSGTEAVMSALRLARAITGRSRFLKFSGCYHGHVDSMLIAAGSGLASQADSAGIDQHTIDATLVAELDDAEQLQSIFSKHASELSAAIIEPLPANYGLLPQRREFIEELQRLCKHNGVLLIFDEVISGFRMGFEGFSGCSKIEPDIVTWGKIIGGGFPVGAYAARANLMNKIAPAGDVYQAGTLSANPVAMRAGLATLQELADGEIYRKLEMLGAELASRLNDDSALTLQRVSSMFWLHPRDASNQTVIRSKRQVDALDEYFPKLFSHLLKQGIYLPPSPYETAFLSAAHSQTDIENLADAINSL